VLKRPPAAFPAFAEALRAGRSHRLETQRTIGQELLKAARGGPGEMTTSRLLRAWALTDSRPSADVTLILLRVADLAAALLGEKRVLARWGGRVRTKVFLNTLRVFLLEPVTSRHLVAPGSRNSFQQPVSKCAC